MQSLKNTKSKPVGRPPKMIKPKGYKYSKRNTVVFIILVIIFLALAFKLGASTVANEPIQQESATLDQPTPTQHPLTVCDNHTLQITDGEIIKECYVNITPTPTPTPAKRSLQPSDEEIVAYIRSKDWDDSTAIRVAKSENFFNLNNGFNCARVGETNQDESRSKDYGIFQINDYWHRDRVESIYNMPFEEAMKDCFKNIDYAFNYVYTSRGNWSAWSAHNNGSYLAHSDTL